MRSIHDLGYFEHQILIDRVGRAIAAFQGWQIDFEGNILESSSPRLLSYAELANVVIEDIKVFTEEISEEDDDGND